MQRQWWEEETAQEIKFIFSFSRVNENLGSYILIVQQIVAQIPNIG